MPSLADTKAIMRARPELWARYRRLLIIRSTYVAVFMLFGIISLRDGDASMVALFFLESWILYLLYRLSRGATALMIFELVLVVLLAMFLTPFVAGYGGAQSADKVPWIIGGALIYCGLIVPQIVLYRRVLLELHGQLPPMGANG